MKTYSNQQTVWKYPITEPRMTLSVPHDYHVLKAAVDPLGQLCIWALVFPHETERVPLHIAVCTTGGKIPVGYEYLDTFQKHDWFVGHVFVKEDGHG